MTNQDVRTAVMAALARIAPEIEAATVRPDIPVRDQVDIDSMDFLNFLVEIHRTLGVDVPESDYREFATLDSAVAYLARRSQPQGIKST